MSKKISDPQPYSAALELSTCHFVDDLEGQILAGERELSGHKVVSDEGAQGYGAGSTEKTWPNIQYLTRW